MIISCNKAMKICDKAQYNEASLWELMILRVHKFICKACSKHTQKNTKLTKLCSKANLTILSEEEKNAIKAKLSKRN